jgi:hypothetical protein
MLHNVLLAIMFCKTCISTDWTLIQHQYDFPVIYSSLVKLDIKYVVDYSNSIEFDHRFLIMDEHSDTKYNLYNYALQNNYDGLMMMDSKTWLNTSQLIVWLENNQDVMSASLNENHDNVYLSKLMLKDLIYNEDLSLGTYNIEDRITIDYKINFSPNKIPVVIFAHKRAKSLQKLLNTVIIADPERKIYVSEDSGDTDVINVINQNSLIHISQKHNKKSYSAISEHFYLTLEELLKKHEKIIILEEDLLVSNDFFHYMDYFEPLLDTDPTLMCISAWNDNGFEGRVKDPTRVYRTHFFPGLGWILTRKYWETIRHGWKNTCWDDLIRNHEFKYGGKQCLFPEISRTEHTFDEIGTSGGEANEYISKVKRNSNRILWGWIYNNKLNNQEYTQWLRKEMDKGIIITGKDDSVLREYELMPFNGWKSRSAFFIENKFAVTPTWHNNHYKYIKINYLK